MKISVIGCGRWGSFIAWYLDRREHEVTLYGRASSSHLKRFREERTNGLITLPETVQLESDLGKALESEVIIISVNSQGLRALMQEIEPFKVRNRTFVLCMKGMEISTGKRLTEVVEEYMEDTSAVAVWLGPGHVQEFYRGIPNCMVIDSRDEKVKERLIESFSSDLIRFYYGNDLIGNEIGGATKNIIGIAAGMLDGLGLSSLKGALMSRGTREISRLIEAMGGNVLSAYGLCHLGDYEATVFSQFSHNRKFGESFVRGTEYTSLAEGYYTVEAIMKISEEHHVDLPICRAVYDVLFHGKDPKETLNSLFVRSLKEEF
ncbi:NAD(P)H-dependent glycerol-3-phosphate dehydrogenase [Proteiniclasticum sp. SCR006]|uniref:Glycerol-3-phosphate dehydrogenase [NAD(P)+] n=1 Tax=Proteiniclasticum aestuarii TaxID=2817862 RepID=A0A939HDL2_9CLOT|nr:NAD(P)H-dependent glycerol-3-phosphate dehydrogenase [Proteiniclasticum aestuarii]MBO1265610.1 NAD(P)H-dependent glycerol-3-phosphate dehydrogenase [Proteiniclasticum aestuarii]